MTEEQANQITIGDRVIVGGRTATVMSIKVDGIAGPYFRTTAGGGLTSWRLVSLPEEGRPS